MAEVDDARLSKALGLYAFGVLGVFLAVAPWTPIWHQAITAALPTAAGPWLTAGWLRGAVSAIGVLDLIVSLQFLFELWHAFHRHTPVDDR